MKWVSFRVGDEIRCGVATGLDVVDLRAADARLTGAVSDFLCPDEQLLDRVHAAIQSGQGRQPLATTELVAPVAPEKFFGVGLNYADHIAETGRRTPDHLVVFAKAVSSVTGPYAAVHRPSASVQLDYEGELGVVIGRRCHHVLADDARLVIGGYTVVNDFSVRDWQTMTPQWSLGKSFDTHGPFGPWIMTADELGDPHSLDLTTYVNGEVRQKSNTRNLIFDCFRQVALLSTVCTLEPGDIITTGTPGGVAAAMEGNPWLVPGDRVKVEIEKLGSIENQVVDEREATHWPAEERQSAWSSTGWKAP